MNLLSYSTFHSRTRSGCPSHLNPVQCRKGSLDIVQRPSCNVEPSFNRGDSAGATPCKSRALRAELLDFSSWTRGLEGILTNFVVDCQKDLQRSLCIGQQSRVPHRPSTRGIHVNTTSDRRFVFAATDSISIDAFRVDSSGARRPMY